MNPVAKLAIAGINMGAAALVGKGLGAAWTKATGNQPPAISHESVVGAVVSFGIARLQRRFFN